MSGLMDRIMNWLADTDQVIEQGTSGDWTYRKWKSGISECWRYARYPNDAMTTQEGYGYYSSIKNISFPADLFTIAPVVTVGTELNGALGNFTFSTTAKNAFSGYFWATRSTTKIVYAHIHAIGHWK